MKAANSTKSEPRYRVQVLERVFRILDLLASHPDKATLPKIAESLRLHKSTAHRLLMILEAERYIERTGSGQYRIGSRVMELGLAALSKLDLYDVAGPHLRELVDETGETAHLAVLRDGEVVSLLNVDGRQTLRTPGAVGARRPAYCTATGKALLAAASDAEVDAVLKARELKAFTRKTITSPARFRAELRSTLKRGYSVDDEEWEVGLRCIGAAVRDSSGAAVAAISISGPVFRIDSSRVPVLSSVVLRVAANLSRSLGYHPA